MLICKVSLISEYRQSRTKFEFSRTNFIPDLGITSSSKNSQKAIPAHLVAALLFAAPGGAGVQAIHASGTVLQHYKEPKFKDDQF